MLEHLWRRVDTALSDARTATLVSDGPGGLQADDLPCTAQGRRLYLLVPQTSDQLVNLAGDTPVVVTAVAWRLHGTARVLPDAAWPAGLFAETRSARWSVLVEVTPTRLELGPRAGWGYAETIDLQ
jgi:hypothetical protein